MLKEVGPFDLTDLKRLGENYFYDVNTRTVLNDNLIPQYSFSVGHNAYFVDGLIIVRKDGICGAIDYEGKIIIPFVYSSISSYIYNGKRVGYHIDGKVYLVEADGTKDEISPLYKHITQGLLYKFQYDEIKEKYVGEIVDYGYNVKINFDFDSFWSLDFNSGFSNIYGGYLVNRYRVNNIDKYILIDTGRDY